MRFAIDISLINHDNAGINQYTREILRELVKYSDHEFLLFARKQEEIPFELPRNTKLIVLPAKPKFLGGWYLSLASRLRKEKVDALLSFALSPAPLFFDRVVSYIHDISPLTHNQYDSWWDTEKYRLLLKLNLWRSKKVLTISQTTADKLKQMFPRFKSEIDIIYPGLAARFIGDISAATIAEFKQAHALGEKFFLSVGTIQPRKNYLNAIKAFHKFLQHGHEAKDWQYVIVGNFGWDYQETINYVRNHKLEEKVKLLTRLTNREVVVAFRAADSFVQLSLDEGFGMPIVEAGANGLPILASDIPVFREIDMEDTIYVNPLNVKDIAAELNVLSAMPKRGTQKKIVDKFSWESNAKKLLTSLTSFN